MIRTPLSLVALVPLVAVLGGCKTPRPALDQANNGVALTVSFNGELNDFHRIQGQVAQARMDSVRRQRVRLAEYEAEGSFDERVLKAADKTEALKLYATLKELSDSRAADETRLEANIASMDETFAKLLEPLPAATKELKATQQALAVLGEELSTQDRIATTAAFVKEIRKAIQETRDRIKAEKSAGEAPLQPEPPPPTRKP